MSATISGTMMPSVAAVMPSSTCTATSRYGLVDEREQQPAQRQCAESRAAGTAAVPRRCAWRPTQGEISATMSCGTTMQAAISTVAHSLDRVVSTLPISGSIAALARWNISTQPARMSSGALAQERADAGRCRRSGLLSGEPPCASSGSISRGANAPERKQRRDQQRGRDEEDRSAARRNIRTRPSTAAATPLPIEAKRALRPSRSPIAGVADQPEADRGDAGPSTQLAAACRHGRREQPERSASTA